MSSVNLYPDGMGRGVRRLHGPPRSAVNGEPYRERQVSARRGSVRAAAN